MFSILKVNSNILDTFKLEASGILYKQLNALRTYEAYQQLNKLISLDDILLKYDEIESQLLVERKTEKIIRVIFSPDDYSYTFTVLDYVVIETPVRLQFIDYPKQLSGLGIQNYKWEQRPFWGKLNQQKKQDAFDIISVNEKNELVETSRFNIFLYDTKSDSVLTPALSSGCINGVFRRLVIFQNYIQLPNLGRKKIQEMNLPINLILENISDHQLFVANSVRGVLPAELL